MIELLIFPFSYAANRFARFWFRLCYRLKFVFSKRQINESSYAWQTINEIVSQKPRLISYLALAAPRWNPHAIIASCGPMRIQNSVAIDISELNRSCAKWYLIVYNAPGGQTVSATSSTNDGMAERKLEVSPGIYTVTLRVYEPQEKMSFPSLSIDDGMRQVEKRHIRCAELPSLEDNVFNLQSGFYRFVHSYMYTMLRYRSWFPKKWIEREYLPVGNPETHFRYGAFDSEQAVSIDFDESSRSGMLVYLTCYNRSSFPVFSTKLEEKNGIVTPRFTEAGFYLLRVLAARDTSNRALNMRVAIL